MPDAFSRDLPAIDGELRALVSLNRDAQQQLGSVRAQINNLQAMELNLIAAMDASVRKADRLLDERLRSVATELVRN